MKLILIVILTAFLTSCTICNPNDHYEEQKRLYEQIYKAQQDQLKAEAELAALKASIHRNVMAAYEKMIRQGDEYLAELRRRMK